MLWVKRLIGICLDLSAIAPVASTFQPTVLRPDRLLRSKPTCHSLVTEIQLGSPYIILRF